MPGENLQKLTKAELKELRAIVRKVHFGEVPEHRRDWITDEECDKLIDALLPETVEQLRESGVNSGFIEAKKFFMPSPIVDAKGDNILK